MRTLRTKPNPRQRPVDPAPVAAPEPSPRVQHEADPGTLLRRLFDPVGMGVIGFDEQLTVVSRNPASEQMLPAGDSVIAILGAAALDRLFADWEAELRAVLATGQPRRFDPVCSMVDPRHPRYLRLVISSFDHGDDARMPGGMRGLLIIEDATVRATMEQRLAVSERLAALGQLAARVAHELNNPLDGILRYVNLGRRLAEGHSDAKLAEYLDHAKSGLLRMAQIVGSLLQYSRNARSGPQDATINALIDEAVRVFEAQATAASVSVICSFHELDMVMARSGSLFQVFCNLIKNAIDAMPSGGTLTIKTRVVNGELIATFEDTGVGLPSDAGRVFEPFFTTKPPGKGTGLGLSVCRDIVERFGGRITAGSRTPRGAVFSVSLPEPAADKRADP